MWTVSARFFFVVMMLASVASAAQEAPGAPPAAQEPNPPPFAPDEPFRAADGPVPASDQGAPPVLEAPLAPPMLPAGPIVAEPRPATPPSLATPARARTQWTPFDGEITRTADGSMDVCAMAVLPLIIVPGVGDIVGTVADWVCVVPAAMAVDYTGAFHGNRSSHFWEPTLALVLKKVWETLIDTPVFVATVAVVVAIAAGGIAVTLFAGLPITVVTAAGIGVTLAVYTGLKAARDTVGDLIFLNVYNLLVPPGDEASSAAARADSSLQPPLTGAPATFGLVATVGGSRAPFAWRDLLPVVGPIWKADARGNDIKLRTHRYANEVLGVDKKDWSGVDRTADVLSTTQGWAMAAGQVGIGVSFGFVGAGLAIALNDPDNEHARTAEIIGGIGLAAAAAGGVAVAVSYGAEKLQSIAVPIAFGLAE